MDLEHWGDATTSGDHPERISGTAPLVDGSEVQVGKFRLTFYASRVDLAHVVGS